MEGVVSRDTNLGQFAELCRGPMDKIKRDSVRRKGMWFFPIRGESCGWRVPVCC
jgi:hypothetical protein